MPIPIVAFAKDHDEDPTSNHHVLHELAKTRRVLWLNSVGTRTPSLGSGRDLGKIRNKLVQFAKGPINVADDLWVASPLVIPLPHSPIARAVNRQVLRATIRALRLRLGIREFQLWTFLPNVADYVGTLGEQLSVYYCVDEWSMFGYLDRDATVAAERELLARVDCVFAVNGALADAKRVYNPETHVAPHGVDYPLFARALDGAVTVPADLASLPRPRIGFYGTLRDWVDLDLIANIARARPSWSIALIGQQLDDVATLRGLPNVHLLGQRRHDALPAYCKGFDVGIIPYRIDARMTYVNPLKLREYLSAGLPVVSTPVPEVIRYNRWCRVASGADEFVAAIDRELAEDSPDARANRSSAMQTETWTARVAAVAKTVDEVAARKHAVVDPVARAADADPAAGVATLTLSEHVPYLVTGASGSVGKAIVERLRAGGDHVRVFVRRIPERVESGIEYCVGDLGDRVAVDRAVRGAAIVIHAGASMTGGWSEHRAGTVVGTQNVIAACMEHGATQLVHISSMSVIDGAGSVGHGPVGEGAALEPRPHERGAYTRAKLEAEQLVVASARRGLPCVILRPGQIFGGGIPLITGAVARDVAGRWLVLGDGKLELPLVYIDDVVDSITLAIAKNLRGGEIIQIIDPVRLTQDDVLALAGGSRPVLRVPRPIVFALGKLSEYPLGRRSPVAVYRLKSALAQLHYESQRAEELLDWHPRVGVREGIKRVTPGV